MTYYKCGTIHPTQNSNVVVDTASGAIANFQTPLAMPLLKTKFDVNAKQDLHGYDNPWPAGGGKNIFSPESPVIVGYIGSSGFSTGNTKSRTTYLKIKPNTTYTASRIAGQRFVLATSEVIPTNGAPYTNYKLKHDVSSITITSGNEDEYLWIYFYLEDTDTDPESKIFASIQVELGSTATSWAPYKNICPIDGVSEISVSQRGSNLFNIATKTDGVFLVWSRGDTYADAKSVVSDYIEVKDGIKFTSNYIAQWCCYDKNKNYLGNIVAGSLVKTSGNDTTINTIPSGYDVYYLRLGYRSALNNDEDMTQKTDIILNVGNTATTYEAYNGQSITINLGGTYYGGYVTQDKNGKRELVVTHNVKLFSELNFGRSNNSGIWEGYRFYALVDKLRGKDVKCSHYEALSVISASVAMDNETLIAPIGNDYVYVRDDNYTTVEEFKTANANTQLWYELDEPFTVALPDGEPIKSFPGVNNIFCDTGDTSLQFRKIG